MTQATLEQRVAALERQVAQLSKQAAATPPVKDWRRTVGMFSGDEGMKEIIAEGRKIREADRRKARAGKVQSKRTKK
jgi:hypothetical protein